MYKEIGKVMELLKYPQSRILELDKVANINSDDEIVFVGKATECAKRLNCKVNNVYEQVLLQKKKHKPRKYYIMKVEE